MASNRLARLAYYNGRVIGATDMNDLVVAQRLADIHSRKAIGEKYLRKAPQVSWVTAGPPSVPTMRVENIDGSILHLPVYDDGTPFDFDPTISNELHADGITGIIGSNDVSGPGFFRTIIIGISYTEVKYDDEVDINEIPVKFRRDDGVCIKIIAGIEEADPDPADPLIADDIIPIAKIIREDSDDAAMIAGTVAIQLIQTWLHWRDDDVSQTLLQSSLLGMQGDVAMVIVDDAALSPYERFLVPFEMNAAGDQILITTDCFFIFQGVIRKISDLNVAGTDTGVPFLWRSPVLSVPGTDRLYLRAQLDAYGTLFIYTLIGEEPSDGVAYDDNAEDPPDPTGGAGGEVSTMSDDVLMGVVDHVTASWVETQYDNNPNYYEEALSVGDYSAGQDTASAIETLITLTLPCAHALRVVLHEDDETITVTGGWASNRTPVHSTIYELHVRHEAILIKAIGRYATINGGTGAMEVSSTDIYYEPSFHYHVLPRFVQKLFGGA